MYYVYEFFLYKSWQVLGANIPRSRKSPGRQRLGNPPIYLHLIFDILQFEISSLMNWIFFLVWTGFLQATQAVKIQLKLGKNPIHQTRNFKLENVKNQVQIDRGCEFQFK